MPLPKNLERTDDTDIGPVVNAKSLENMKGIVSRTIKSGAELLTGGERADDKGYFFRPTIFKNVLPNMEIAQEEVFGPIAPIITANDEKEAMKIANDSKFGLGARSRGGREIIRNGRIWNSYRKQYGGLRS
jgi:succinate-semialdehyde dehydrogenase/glutarate-semialdehyde dehydrogenase/succinyl-CoA reductase